MEVLRALLLTDVVDSTGVSQRLGEAQAARLWTAHDRAARDLIPLWRGREIDKTDGLLLIFDGPADALGYALAYHQALTTLAPPLQARAGLHVGLVRLRENSASDIALGAKPIEVDGLALPTVARLMALALGGQTLLSADARAVLGVTTRRLQSHGHWRLQGLADPVELFEAGDATAPFLPPPDQAKAYRVARQGDVWLPVREVRHNIPAERDSFVGRQEPLQELACKFERGARLVSVLGIGGTGKTRLVTRFAWTWLGDYPGGVWFCDLSQARGVDGIHFAVAQGLDVSLGKTDPAVQLAHAIVGRGKCLLILDNFEQVARHAEETLGRWLDRAVQAHFLVTTREVLGIVGEETLALAPLPATDAALLFTRRAEATKATFRASADDALAIAQLVKVLDGLPLAIELAAARVRVMTPRVLLARMNERFNVLLSRAGRHDRQATLRAAFDWSWELLSEPEKAALAQLSVFQGGFTLESADAVIDLSALADTPPSVDVVQWLVDKSLVRPLADDRFDLLESVRDYAGEHLRTEGRYRRSGPSAQDDAQCRHGRFFASERPGGWSNEELDNLALACRLAVGRRDGGVAIRTLSAAWSRLRLRGPFSAGQDLASLVRDIVASLSDSERVQLDVIAGSVFELCGPGGMAQQYFEAAARGAHALGDQFLEARALSPLARLKAQQGQLSEAEALNRKALAMARATNDPLQQCCVLNQLGSLFEACARPDQALAAYEEALRIASAQRDRRWEGGSAGNLGQFFANQGKPAQAGPLYLRAVKIAIELGDRQWEANARCNLGLLHFSQGKLVMARGELESALLSARELGHRRLLSIVQCNLGLVEEAEGNTDSATGRYREAIDVARELNDRRSEGQFLGYLGLSLARGFHFEEARDLLRQGSALLDAVGDHVSRGILLCACCEAEHLAGETGASRRALAEAEIVATQLGEVAAESEFGAALARSRTLVARLTPSCT
jgi:predicted ATPase/class 3 adenylate cyclase/tetratricopeptide (TPR) repeat protein